LSSRAVRFALGCCLAAGCSSPEAAEDRAVVAAVETLRRSSADDLMKRRALVDALAKLPATTSLARNARDACADAYRLLVDGKEGTAKLKRALAETGRAPKDALIDLAAVEDLIRRSERAMPGCNTAAAELVLSRR
jgi:hypothetical protein